MASSAGRCASGARLATAAIRHPRDPQPAAKSGVQVGGSEAEAEGHRGEAVAACSDLDGLAGKRGCDDAARLAGTPASASAPSPNLVAERVATGGPGLGAAVIGEVGGETPIERHPADDSRREPQLATKASVASSRAKVNKPRKQCHGMPPIAGHHDRESVAHIEMSALGRAASLAAKREASPDRARARDGKETSTTSWPGSRRRVAWRRPNHPIASPSCRRVTDRPPASSRCR